MVWIRSSGVEILENRWFGLELQFCKEVSNVTVLSLSPS